MSELAILERGFITGEAEQPAVILLVDDEPSILSSLKRLLRPCKYRILTAEGGATGLNILAQETVNLIISDMRMPGMTGAQFLAQAKTLYPDTVRILLTGYSEVSATVSAINEGGIHHYLPKPWDDQDLLLTVKRALEQQQLKLENERFAKLVQSQNQELSNFNRTLEKQVASRTEEIRQTVMFLESAHKENRTQFLTMLNVFASMIELRSGALAGQSSRVSDLAKKLAQRLQLSEHLVDDIMIAGLLYGIGKLGLPDDLVRKPMDKMGVEETRLFLTHPAKGQMLLTPVFGLADAGKIIAAQYERWDGRGTPHGLQQTEIEQGARILAMVRDFLELCSGAIATQPLPLDKARAAIKTQSGIRYDPQLVTEFLALIAEPGVLKGDNVKVLTPIQLRSGMRLSEDLRTHDGMLLLPKNRVLDQLTVEHIQRFEQAHGNSLDIKIVVER